MRRIDAHQHYWRLRRADYGWLTTREGLLYRDFMPEDLAATLEECAIDQTLLVQAAATEAETRFLLDLARQHPSVAGVIGWVDFEASDVSERIRSLIRQGGGQLKGLRPMIQDIADPDWLGRKALDSAFEAVLHNQLVFDALVKPKHLALLERRIQLHPGLKTVLDHAGKPDIAAGEFETWSAQIERLGRLPSVYCKLSGLLTQAAPGAGLAELDRFVARLFECFGGDRIIWGSDWPIVTLCASYREWLDLSLELVRRHAPRHAEAVFAGNATRLYGLSQ